MNKPKVSIIDYGIGNLFSVKKACEFVGIASTITSDIKEIMSSDAIILPGVGAFGDAMESLHKFDLVSPIVDFANSGKPLMGVCLGLQLLLSESEELGRTKGLGIVDGTCKKFPLVYDGSKIKVPQITWNSIYPPNRNKKFELNTPLEGINKGEYMYFIHSYYADLVREEEVLSKTNYGGIEYCSSIKKNNIFSFQFHPEKSGKEGLKIYQRYNDLIKTYNLEK
jgi:imidazole glycerol-phosphate synthase subunit HisH